MNKKICILVISICFIILGSSRKTIVEKSEVTNKPISPEVMSTRLNNTAVKYKKYAPIPRIIQCDIAFPKNLNEYTKLNTFCVIMVTAQSQKREEIPLSKIYYKLDDKNFNLIVIKTNIYKVTGEMSTKVFGQWRSDTYCCIPYKLLQMKGKLCADFSKNRKGMIFYKTPVRTILTFLKKSSCINFDPGKSPDTKILKSFISREFKIKLK